MIFDKLVKIRDDVNKEKLIITISGEVGSGKSTISVVLGLLLKEIDVKAKIIDLDDFYKIPPLERRKWRLKHGLKSIGYDEYDWGKVYENISAFYQNQSAAMPCVDLITRYVDQLTTNYEGVDILIINGLYSLKIKEADLKVFVEHTYEQTRNAQIYSQKENIDEYRLKIMEREHEVVTSMKSLADFYIDFENSLYHL